MMGRYTVYFQSEDSSLVPLEIEFGSQEMVIFSNYTKEQEESAQRASKELQEIKEELDKFADVKYETQDQKTRDGGKRIDCIRIKCQSKK